MAIIKTNYRGLESDAHNLVYLDTETASNSSAVNFDNTYVNSTYNEYLLIGRNVRPATDNAEAYFAVSVDNGSNILGATAYSGRTYVRVTNSAAGGDEQNSITSYVRLASDLGNDGDGSFSLWIYGTNTTDNGGSNTWGDCTYSGKHGTDDYTWDTGFVFQTGTSAVNYFRFQMDSGNVTHGDFTLYGIRK